MFYWLFHKKYKRDFIRYRLLGFSYTVKNPNLAYRGKNNHIYIYKEGKKTEHFTSLRDLEINILGDNNLVEIHYPINIQNSKISIAASNCSVKIQNSKYPACANFYIEIKSGNNQHISIGKNFSCVEKCEIWMHEENSNLEIGENVMISRNVSILTSDSHAILDMDTSKIINFRKNNTMKIGDNVWIGRNSILTKNANIANNTILGAGTVLTKNILESNTCWGGNPAKKIRENIYWKRESITSYLRKDIK